MKTVSLAKLSVKGAKFFAYHGVKTEERSIGGKFEVDLDMYYDSTAAVIKDDVNYALNYEEAFEVVERVIGSEEGYALLETIVREILNALCEKFPQLKKATVRVRKINAPVNRFVEYIEAEQTVERTDNE